MGVDYTSFVNAIDELRRLIFGRLTPLYIVTYKRVSSSRQISSITNNGILKSYNPTSTYESAKA